MSNGEKFVTVEEAASRLSITPKTLREWLKAGKIRGIRLGGHTGPGRHPWRISEAALAEFTEASPSNIAAPVGSAN